MYCKCGVVSEAQKLFDEITEKNVVVWNSLICGYLQVKCPLISVNLFMDMLKLGIDPAPLTMQIHCCVIREGFEANEYVVVTLMTVYSECNGSLDDFWKACSGISKWDKVSLNALIAGLSNLGYGEEALIRYSLMREAGIETDHFVFSSILNSAGIISALNDGKKIHALILKYGYASNLNLQNGLVSMYARCGNISDSKKAFSSMDSHDVISWNSLLSGYAHHGHGKEAVELFEKMKSSEIKPNDTTFLAVLTACSHVGMLDKGLQYFELMMNDKTLAPPRMEHYAIIVDLLGRYEYLPEAESIINKMPIEAGPSTYKSLLNACRIHGNKEIALRSAEKLLKLYPDDPATYILLSNILHDRGNWADGAGVRKLMYVRGLAKNPGYSWI
ncbi:hypothetical protein AHAS_Ahas08G0065900 [Arachis hypogaea]